MKKTSFLLVVITIMFTSTLSSQTLSLSSQNEKALHAFPELPYAYDALKQAIDSETMNIHYNKHFRGYHSKFLKAIEGSPLEKQSLEDIFANVSKYPEAVRNNAGGFYNHAMFWTIMSPDGGGEPTGKLAEAINKSFGSFEAFKTAFEKAAASRFGSGWAWLSVDEGGKLFISSTANQDNPLMDVNEKQGHPILCLDVWEHAYYLRYQNQRTSYIGNFWKVVNWDEVANRMKK